MPAPIELKRKLLYGYGEGTYAPIGEAFDKLYDALGPQQNPGIYESIANDLWNKFRQPRTRSLLSDPQYLSELYKSETGKELDLGRALPAPVQAPVTPPPPPAPLPGIAGQAPDVFGLLPEKEQRALAQSSELEQVDRKKALEDYLASEETALSSYTQKARDVFIPGFERSIKRGAELLGGQGLGSGGFFGSGAYQELVRKGAQELEEAATLPALEGYRQAGSAGRVFGFDTSQVPIAYRRAGLERGFAKSDAEIEQEYQERLARITGEYQKAAAKAGKPSIIEQIIGGAASGFSKWAGGGFK